MATGDYMGEHWLASFAVYLLGIPKKALPGLVTRSAAASLPPSRGDWRLATGDSMGEHWLASFAVYLLGVPH